MELVYFIILILVVLGLLLNLTLSFIMLAWVKKDKIVETPRLVLYANIIHKYFWRLSIPSFSKTVMLEACYTFSLVFQS